MPKPFPYPLSIGIDICAISRVKAILSQTGKVVPGKNGFADKGKRFVNRVLNDRERDGSHERLGVLEELGAEHLSPDVKQKLSGLAVFMAGRWAAKEAIIKAHSPRKVFMQDITIQAMQKGHAPLAYVRAPSGKEEDSQEVKISISHDGDYATAICLATVQQDEEAGSEILKEIGIKRPRDPTSVPGNSSMCKTTTIQVQNLPLYKSAPSDQAEAFTSLDLLKAFSKYASVAKAHILMNRNGKPTSSGFIVFNTKYDAEKAMVQMNGAQVYGAEIHCEWTKLQGIQDNAVEEKKVENLSKSQKRKRRSRKWNAAIKGEVLRPPPVQDSSIINGSSLNGQEHVDEPKKQQQAEGIWKVNSGISSNNLKEIAGEHSNGQWQKRRLENNVSPDLQIDGRRSDQEPNEKFWTNAEELLSLEEAAMHNEEKLTSEIANDRTP